MSILFSENIALSALEEKNGNLAKIEVDEVFGLVGNVRSEVPSDNAMPCGVVLLVEFLLDVCGNVLLDVVFLEGLGRRNWMVRRELKFKTFKKCEQGRRTKV